MGIIAARVPHDVENAIEIIKRKGYESEAIRALNESRDEKFRTVNANYLKRQAELDALRRRYAC